MIIAIDFDGTMVTHDYPEIGKDIGAAPVIRALQDRGHKIILFTMRSRLPLSAAVDWCKDNGIELYGINENPTQNHWTTSPKPYAQIYIDDAALGVPLINNPALSHRPYVDWIKVAEYFCISAKELTDA